MSNREKRHKSARDGETRTNKSMRRNLERRQEKGRE